MSLLDIPLPLWLHIQSHLHWQDRLAHTIQLCHILPARCVWTDTDHVRLSPALHKALLNSSRSAAHRLCTASSLDIGAHGNDVEVAQALLDGLVPPFRTLLEQLSAVEQPLTNLHTLLCSDCVLQCMFDCGIHLPQLHSLSLWPLYPSHASVGLLLYAHRRRLPSLQRLKLHRFSLQADDHRQLLSLPDLELLDISRCSWSERDIAPTVLSLPAPLTHLLLDAGPVRSLPVMDGLLDTLVGSSAAEHLTTLGLRANLQSTSLHLLSALHNLVSLDLGSSLPDESFFSYFVSSSSTPLLPGLLYFDASECSYESCGYRHSISSFVAFIEAYHRLRHFGALLTQQMAAAHLHNAALRVLAEVRTLELPCVPHMHTDEEEDGTEGEESHGPTAAASSRPTITPTLQYLRSLSLRSSQLTDAALVDVVSACPALKHLMLPDSQELTTASFMVVARYAPQLKVLHLSGPNVKFGQGAWREAASMHPHLAHFIPIPAAPPAHSLGSEASAATSAPPAAASTIFLALEQLSVECPYASQLDSAGLTTLVAMLRSSPLHTLSIELPAEDSAAFYLLHLAPLQHLRCLCLAPTWNSSGLRRQRPNSVTELLKQCTEPRKLDRRQWERCVAAEWDGGGLLGGTGSAGEEEQHSSVWWQMGVESDHASRMERVFKRSSGESRDGREMFFQRLREVCD